MVKLTLINRYTIDIPGDKVKVSETHNLKVIHPELAEQWHPTKNGELTPDKVAPYTAAKVWWKCYYGHEWQAAIGSRAKGIGCPYCYGRYPTEDYNLQVMNPEVAAQWHPTKNGDLTPDKVAPNSVKKVWWICENGHEWQAKVCDRNKGTGCRLCKIKEARGKTRGTISLRSAYPETAAQWHPTKNGELTPDNISYGSKRKVWWMCGEGHEWQAAVKKRTTYGTKCPYCSGHLPDEKNNLAVVYPDLARQWHPTKNGELKPRQITPGTKQKIWWLCEKGHAYETSVLGRTNGAGCPYCSRKRPSKDYNLQVIFPDIAAQWHPVKNGDLTPDQVMPHASTKVWWRCEKGHEWWLEVSNRRKGGEVRGCPICAGRKRFKKVDPDLIRQWHPTKNGKNTAETVDPNSTEQIWWICEKAHEWQMSILDRHYGAGCPECKREQ
jgi:uncharacterized Zn-finger protein